MNSLNTVLFLIGFPLVVALLLLVLSPKSAIQKILVRLSAVIIGTASIYLCWKNMAPLPILLSFDSLIADKIILGLEAVMAIYILYLGFKHRRPLVALLVAAQLAILIPFEVLNGHAVHVEHNLYIDNFSIIMALIIGIIGSLICVYAIGYMKDFQEHLGDAGKDRRRFFFFILFLFLSAMFGIVFSNNLMWLYFFWEVTTLCSFWLIGYKKDAESTNNAFLALTFNLLGGVAFAGGIYLLYAQANTIELDKMLQSGKALVLVPAALIGFAGLTKSAQLPFSKWLLGAMVAPTPVSALLHSSTMVKAGVFVIIKLAPIYAGTTVGLSLAFIGGVTFLFTALLAISQSNAKRVLAYSTISNLGLIVACGGIGTSAAIWAAIFLIVFHAIAKALLFQCVGVVEHKIHSRDIEDMDTLIKRLPGLSALMVIGIAGMFLAPFGMLISKWVTLRAFVDANPILAVMLAFGSAATLFFWTKWLGKLVGATPTVEPLKKKISADEWFVLVLMGIMTVAACLVFSLISSAMVEPYLVNLFSETTKISNTNVIIMLFMMAVILVLPVSVLLFRKNKSREVGAYLGGSNTGDGYTYVGSMNIKYNLSMSNYYIEEMFGEKKLFATGAIISITLILIMLGVGAL